MKVILKWLNNVPVIGIAVILLFVYLGFSGLIWKKTYFGGKGWTIEYHGHTAQVVGLLYLVLAFGLVAISVYHNRKK